MGQIIFFIKEFILGGLIIYHSINLSKKVGPLKKNCHFLGNQCKVAIYTGCQKIIYSPTPSAFLAICEGFSKTTDVIFSNQF